MTAMNSGMHVLFMWNALTLQRVVRHLFFWNYLIPAPEGYQSFCPSPGEYPSISDDLQAALRSGEAGPEFSLPVNLTWVRDGASGTEDVQVVFGFDARVETGDVCVEMNFLRVSPSDVEGLSDYLAAQSPARWRIPMDWLNMPDSGNDPIEAVVGIGAGSRGNHLAVGVAIYGFSDADPVRFHGGFEIEREEYGTKIVVSDDVMRRFLDLFVEDTLNREAAGERLFGLDSLGYDYSIDTLAYDWGTDPYIDWRGQIEFTATGQIFILDDWRDMVLTFECNFIPQKSDDIFDAVTEDWDRSDRLLRTVLRVNYPTDIHLPHHPELEPGLDYAISSQYFPIISGDDYTPSAYIPFRPVEMGDFVVTATNIFMNDVRLVINAIEPEEYDLDRASIMVDPLEFHIEFTRNFVEPVRTCSGHKMPWNEGVNYEYLTISNPGSVPVSVALSSNYPTLIDFSTDAFTLGPGDSQRVRIEILTDHLPLYHDPDTEFELYDDIEVYVHHTASALETPITVTGDARINFEHSYGHGLSDDAVDALCGFWDIMMLKRGFLSIRDQFVDLPDDRPDYLSAIDEIFVISLRDPRNRYEFVAESESGDMLAVDSSNTLYKTLQFAVPPNESLALSVRYRNENERSPQGPFHWIIRGFVVEPTAIIGAEGIDAFTLSPHGLIAVGPAGITLIDTIDLRKPFKETAIRKETQMVDITSTQDMAFAVGGHTLLILNLKSQKGVEIIASHKIPYTAALIRRAGNHLWIAGNDRLMCFKMDASDRIEMVSAARLEAPTLDIAAHRNGVVALDKHGATLYCLDDDKDLKRLGWIRLEVEPGSIFTAGGELIGITSRRQGTRFIDFSDAKSPGISVTYRNAHWAAGMSIDITRNMTYRLNADKKVINIGLIRTRRVEKR